MVKSARKSCWHVNITSMLQNFPFNPNEDLQEDACCVVVTQFHHGRVAFSAVAARDCSSPAVPQLITSTPADTHNA